MSTADIINSWFRDRCAGGPLGRDTEAYNQVAEALPDLIARVEAAAPAAAPVTEAKTKA
jgi:hypothetical protein